MSIQGYAEWHYRNRWWVAAFVLVLSPIVVFQARNFELRNEIRAWFRHDDPYWEVYREFRDEFGGSRSLIIVLESESVFTRPVLGYLRELTEKLERLPHVLQVYSLANANQVLATEDVLEVRTFLEDLENRRADDIWKEVLDEPDVVGDFVSSDGTLAAITVNFHEEEVDPVRQQIMQEIRELVETDRPPDVAVHFNGSLAITEAYDRQNVNDLTIYPPIVALIIGVVSFLVFRSWSRALIILGSSLLALGWTLGIYGLLGFQHNILSTILVPLVVVIAVADDVHLLQRFDRVAGHTGDLRQAFEETLSHELAPIFGAGLTTALGLASLATSEVAAIREFGIASSIGVMTDFFVSFSLVPLALTLLPQRERGRPGADRLGTHLARFARATAAHHRVVLAFTAVIALVSLAGVLRIRTSTNHIEFFPDSSPLVRSARLIDDNLAGVYSFEVVLDGQPDTFKDPDVLGVVDELNRRIEAMPDIRRAVSFLGRLKRVNQELEGGEASSYTIPDSRDAVAQATFLMGLNEDGREELRSFVATDFSRMRIWVKLQSTTSEEVFRRVEEVEELADTLFAGTPVRATVTGAGRLLAALDDYIVRSQIRSLTTAFLTVFGVIFLVFRSIRYGLLSILPNVVPILIVLGVMGWLDISLNIATVMVASMALGIIDDDTVHFIMRYRDQLARLGSMDGAIAEATVQAGGAALVAAVINALAFSITTTSEYEPTAFWGYLMALTMIVAFLCEIILLPALIRSAPRSFGPDANPAKTR